MKRYATYEAAYNAAVDLARLVKAEVGLACTKEYGKNGYNVFCLPRADKRFGHELRCEVVRPTDPKVAAL